VPRAHPCPAIPFGNTGLRSASSLERRLTADDNKGCASIVPAASPTQIETAPRPE